MKCHKHPKYEGKNKPRAHCPFCWRAYKDAHEDEELVIPQEVWDEVKDSNDDGLTDKAEEVIKRHMTEMIKELMKVPVVEVCSDDNGGVREFPFLVSEMNSDTAFREFMSEHLYDTFFETYYKLEK